MFASTLAYKQIIDKLRAFRDFVLAKVYKTICKKVFLLYYTYIEKIKLHVKLCCSCGGVELR